MRIIGSDYDGTLSHGGIDEQKRQAISKWRALGNYFVLVSGRGAASLGNIRQSQQLQLDYYLGCNGGILMDQNGELLWGEEFPEEAPSFLASMQALGCPLAYISTAYTQYTIRLQGPLQQDEELYLHQLPPIDRVHQITVRLTSPAHAVQIAEQIQRLYGSRVTPLQNNALLDIVPKGVNKAAGLRRVAAMLGCTDADVISVGDNINDLDMLTAFRSYAMANGVEAAKQAAMLETTSITELIDAELAAAVV